MVFERTLKNEKPTDERTLEDAFQTLYSKGGKFDWNAVNFDRFRTDMLEVDISFVVERFASPVSF